MSGGVAKWPHPLTWPHRPPQGSGQVGTPVGSAPVVPAPCECSGVGKRQGGGRTEHWKGGVGHGGTSQQSGWDLAETWGVSLWGWMSFWPWWLPLIPWDPIWLLMLLPDWAAQDEMEPAQPSLWVTNPPLFFLLYSLHMTKDSCSHLFPSPLFPAGLGQLSLYKQIHRVYNDVSMWKNISHGCTDMNEVPI